MMFNCKDLSHWPVDFDTFVGCSMDTTVNRIENYIDDQIEKLVEQILMKY